MIAAFSSQVYFGYGLSFIFGIYVTQLDLFGQVQMLCLETLKFWWWWWLQGWRATCVLAIMMMITVVMAMMVIMMMVITSGLASNICTCRCPWLAPCSPPLPCRGAKEQWSQVFNFEHQVPRPLDAIPHYQNFSLITNPQFKPQATGGSWKSNWGVTVEEGQVKTTCF